MKLNKWYVIFSLVIIFLYMGAGFAALMNNEYETITAVKDILIGLIIIIIIMFGGLKNE